MRREPSYNVKNGRGKCGCGADFGVAASMHLRRLSLITLSTHVNKKSKTRFIILNTGAK